MGDLLGYARTSTPGPVARIQHQALEAAGCIRVWTDEAGAGQDRRPQLAAVLDRLRPGDALVVWRLDRLGRDLRHLIATVAELEEREVAFRSLTEAIDTATPAGRLYLRVFGALAEFEAAMIRERTVAGLQAARARGRRGGRPRAMTADKLALARRLCDEGNLPLGAIADTVQVSRSTLYRYLRDGAGDAAAVEGLAGSASLR